VLPASAAATPGYRSVRGHGRVRIGETTCL
jgi:hypothetical protein